VNRGPTVILYCTILTTNDVMSVITTMNLTVIIGGSNTKNIRLADCADMCYAIGGSYEFENFLHYRLLSLQLFFFLARPSVD